MLDGQQRATGIALGFFDIWQYHITDAPSALWLDLGNPTEKSQLAHVFRVVTQSHPWGYKRSDLGDRLSATQIRTALRAFQQANKEKDSARPNEFSLLQTWPWDSEAPVPVAILIDALNCYPSDIEKARKHAWERIKFLPLLAAELSETLAENVRKVDRDAEQQCKNQRDRITQSFTKEDSRLWLALNEVFEQ